MRKILIGFILGLSVAVAGAALGREVQISIGSFKKGESSMRFYARRSGGEKRAEIFVSDNYAVNHVVFYSLDEKDLEDLKLLIDEVVTELDAY